MHFRAGYHTCPTPTELVVGFAGAFVAGVGLGVLGAVLMARSAR